MRITRGRLQEKHLRPILIGIAYGAGFNLIRKHVREYCKNFAGNTQSPSWRDARKRAFQYLRAEIMLKTAQFNALQDQKLKEIAIYHEVAEIKERKKYHVTHGKRVVS